jgi:hypothetical protein
MLNSFQYVTVAQVAVRLAQYVDRWTENRSTRVQFPDGAGHCRCDKS